MAIMLNISMAGLKRYKKIAGEKKREKREEECYDDYIAS